MQPWYSFCNKLMGVSLQMFMSHFSKIGPECILFYVFGRVGYSRQRREHHTLFGYNSIGKKNKNRFTFQNPKWKSLKSKRSRNHSCKTYMIRFPVHSALMRIGTLWGSKNSYFRNFQSSIKQSSQSHRALLAHSHLTMSAKAQCHKFTNQLVRAKNPIATSPSL